MNERAVAITGACGFIGAHLTKKYLDEGRKVVAIDNLLRGNVNRLPRTNNNLTIVNADVRHDQPILIEAFSKANTVFHLAAVNGTENFYSNPDLVLDVGIKGIMNVMDSCKSANIKNIIVASSAEVYQTPQIYPTPEDVPLMLPNSLNPRYSYGGSKIITELISMNYHKEFFERVMIFRPHNVYGPDMGAKHVIPQLILKSLELCNHHQQNILKIIGNPSSSRAFAYIDDIIDGLLLLEDTGDHREIYNIGNDVEVTVTDLATEILHLLDVTATIETDGSHEGGTLRRCPSIEKIKSLGYRPRFSLTDGLIKTIEWYSNKYEEHSNKLL